MKNIFLDIKIKKELKEFQNFKKNYKFDVKEIITKDDGSVFCDGVCLKQIENNEVVGETENLVNVGFNIKNTMSRIISNLFPYVFYFQGQYVNSIESVFQALKFKNKQLQKMVFKYYAIPSNIIKGASNYDWTKTGDVYFLNKKFNRFSKEYENFIDKLYVSAIQNKLYKNALINIGKKHIIHIIGKQSKKETLFTMEEFEKELNCLKDFLILKKTKEEVK